MGDHDLTKTVPGKGCWVAHCSCGETFAAILKPAAEDAQRKHAGLAQVEALREAHNLHAVTGEDAGASDDTHADVGQSGALEGGDDAA